MSDPFDWQIGEENDEADTSLPQQVEARRFWLTPLLFLVLTAVVTGILIGGWRTGETQLAEASETLRQQVETAVALQQAAFANRDGDLFLSLFAADPGWRMAQLQPDNQAFWQAALEVTRVQQQDGLIWANVVGEIDGQPLQRVLFFQQTPSGLVQVEQAPAYWGNTISRATDWGTLRLSQTDMGWAADIDTFVADVVQRQCAKACLDRAEPLVVTVAKDFGETAVARHVTLPSPRLLGLDETVAPAQRFWDMLEARIVQQITPAVVRFGVPPSDYPLLDYEQAAQSFMAQNPHIAIELVPLETAVVDSATLAHLNLDGLALLPTEEMLAQGLIRDLTDYVGSDPDFDESDFYEQIWQASWWQDRFWFVPQAARMRVLYYDRRSYQQLDRPEPSLRWTWDELDADMDAFASGDIRPEWGLLDVGNDALFAYAYNWGNTCTESATVRCQRQLEPEAVAAALTWYADMVGQPGKIPDLTRSKLPLPQSLLDDEARNIILSNWQSAQRRAVIWVEEPLYYELRFQLSPMGVVPFPGSDRFDGITPLWVQGHAILQQSQRPLATWQWIKFLSNQVPASRFRLIPARPSVATHSQYWTTLPRPLGDAMRIAFPFARPVRIDEQETFTWAQITAVLSGEKTAVAAADMRPRIRWFSHPQE